MSNFGEIKCCIETITYDVVFTVAPAPGDDVLVDINYYLFKVVKCTPDCNSNDDPVTITGNRIMWTERKKHNIVNCRKPGSVAEGFKIPKKCKCEKSFMYKGLMSDKKFNQWRHFVRKLNVASTDQIKDILRHQGDRFCKFTFSQIKKCCRNKENFGEL